MSKFSFPLLIEYSIFQGLNVQRRQTNSRNTYLQTCIGREVATQNIHLARPTLFVGVDIKTRSKSITMMPPAEKASLRTVPRGGGVASW